MTPLFNSIEYVRAPENRYLLRSVNESDGTVQRLDYTPDSAEWFEWLGRVASFRFEGKHGHFTSRHEVIHGKEKAYWYAYRGIGKRQFKRYLGATSKLALAYLEESAQRLEQTIKEKLGIPAEKPIPTHKQKGITPNEKALLQRIEKQEQEIAELKARNQELEAQLQEITAKRERRVGPKAEEKAPEGFAWLTDFARQHFVPYGGAERLYTMGMIQGRQASS